MTVESLKRVMWRVRKNNPNEDHPSYNDLRKAIMVECGVHRDTYKSNFHALKKLGWLKHYTRGRFSYTDKDLTDSC